MHKTFTFRTNKKGPLAVGNQAYEHQVDARSREEAWGKMCILMEAPDKGKISYRTEFVYPSEGGSGIDIATTKPHMWFLAGENTYFHETDAPELPALKPFTFNLRGMVTTTLTVYAANEDAACDAAKKAANKHVASEPCNDWEVEGLAE